VFGEVAKPRLVWTARAVWPVRAGTNDSFMKTTIAILAIASMLSSATAAEPWKPTSTALDKPGSTSLATSGAATISGLVIQRTSAGLLIKTSKRGDGGHVWLRGYDAKVGQRITVRAVKGDPEEFATTGGAARMIDGYDAQ
jgi:hypothetical protein